MGIDNVHAPNHDAFQLPGRRGPLPHVQTATNVVLSDEGWITPRPHAVVEEAIAAGQGMTQVGDRVFYQNGSDLYEVGNPTVLVTGLTGPAKLMGFGGRVFGSDGTTHFEIDASTVRGWGLPVPTVALDVVPGNTFEPGAYLVECTFVDDRNEGGASTLISAPLSAPSNIEVLVSGHDDRVQGVNLYISEPNQPTTSFAKLFAVAGPGQQVFSAVPATTINSPTLTRRMQGPPVGLDGGFAFRAFLMTYSGNALFRSQAQEPHLFNLKEWIYQVPGSIRGGGGLPTGFALGTSEGIWWLTGEEPPYVGTQKTFEPVLKGAMVIAGNKLPFLKTSDPVVLFMQSTGLTAVLPSGNIVPITQDRYHVDTDRYSEAMFAYAGRQLLVGLK